MNHEEIARDWFEFNPTDWLTDVSLRACSSAARGLWINLICHMHSCKPYGHLKVNGRAFDETQIARLTTGDVEEITRLLRELEENGVFSRDEDGAIYSRRMVRDRAAR
jgi:hypothetical protein